MGSIVGWKVNKVLDMVMCLRAPVAGDRTRTISAFDQATFAVPQKCDQDDWTRIGEAVCVADVPHMNVKPNFDRKGEFRGQGDLQQG